MDMQKVNEEQEQGMQVTEERTEPRRKKARRPRPTGDGENVRVPKKRRKDHDTEESAVPMSSEEEHPRRRKRVNGIDESALSRFDDMTIISLDDDSSTDRRPRKRKKKRPASEGVSVEIASAEVAVEDISSLIA